MHTFTHETPRQLCIIHNYVTDNDVQWIWFCTVNAFQWLGTLKWSSRKNRLPPTCVSLCSSGKDSCCQAIFVLGNIVIFGRVVSSNAYNTYFKLIKLSVFTWTTDLCNLPILPCGVCYNYVMHTRQSSFPRLMVPEYEMASHWAIKCVSMSTR